MTNRALFMALPSEKRDLLRLLSFPLLLPEAFVFSSQPLQFGLIGLDLPLLVLLSLLLSHQLVADQSSGNEPYRPANQRACGGMSNRASYDRSRSSPEARPDQAAFFSCRYRTGTGGQDRPQQDHGKYRQKVCSHSDASHQLILALLLDLFELSSLPLQLSLIGLDLPLLVLLLLVLALKLVTHQRPGAQSKQAADGRAGARTSDRSTDNSARRCAA
jgi:hypothetical protein